MIKKSELHVKPNNYKAIKKLGYILEALENYTMGILDFNSSVPYNKSHSSPKPQALMSSGDIYQFETRTVTF